jgi:hypothetical protein
MVVRWEMSGIAIEEFILGGFHAIAGAFSWFDGGYRSHERLARLITIRSPDASLTSPESQALACVRVKSLKWQRFLVAGRIKGAHKPCHGALDLRNCGA